jgi:hypothetical protein
MKRLVLPLLLLALACPAQARTLPPGDECAADADFARFRAELLDAVARHDAARLLGMTADDIEFSFGGESGKAAFVATWGLADPHASGLWRELAQVLASGCAREGEEMSSPYWFSRFPDHLDAFDSGLAGPQARLYATPSVEAASVPIAWQVLAEAAVEGGWARVRLEDGRSGHIEAADLLSPIGYRALFARRGGAWRMVAFIAGD